MHLVSRLLRSVSTLLAGAALLLGAGSIGRAATETFSISFPGPDATTYQITDWTTSLNVSKFDPSLGVLQSISFAITGRVQGTAKFESQDGSPTTITTKLSALISLDRPDNSVIGTALPIVNTSTPVTAYDGTTDFAGSSGRTFTGEQNTLTSNVNNDTSATDLSLFTGTSHAPGMISLPTSGTGLSSASGSGNLLTSFSTSAGADLVVTYMYAPVPEPGTCLLLLGGIGALIGVQRFRHRL